MREYENINLTDHPCEARQDYRLEECLRRVSDTEVRCRTFWTDRTGSSLPDCQNSSRIMQNLMNYNRVINSDKTTIYQETGCLYPCHYFEYKVALLEYFPPEPDPL